MRKLFRMSWTRFQAAYNKHQGWTLEGWLRIIADTSDVQRGERTECIIARGWLIERARTKRLLGENEELRDAMWQVEDDLDTWKTRAILIGKAIERGDSAAVEYSMSILKECGVLGE